MRLVALFLFSSTFLLFGSGPSDVLLGLLESVNEKQAEEVVVDELDALAISPFCGPLQKKQIERSWNSLALWASLDEVTFVKGVEKVEGDLAAVVAVGKVKSNPDGLRVFGFGLRRIEGEWKVAPVEGSFANSGLGYGKEEREQARVMMLWLAKARVMEGDRFRKEALEVYREELRGLVDAEVLKKATREEALAYFLKAVFEKKPSEMLVWQGVLERGVDDDYEWDRVSEVAKLGLAGKDQQKIWRLLTDPGVIRLQVSEEVDESDDSILMGFIAPYEAGLRRQRNQVIRFHLENHGVGWRVKMPAFFSYADVDSSSHFNAHQQEIRWRDEDFSRRLAGLFEKENKPRRAKTPEELMELLVKDLGEKAYPEFARLLFRDPAPEVKGEEEKGGANSPDERYQSAAKWWGDVLTKKDGAVCSAMKVKSEGGLALGIMKVSFPGEWEADFKQTWMRKTGEGWSFIPTKKDVPESMKKELDALDKFYAEEEKNLEENAEKEFFSTVSTFVTGQDAPSEEAAHAAVKQWRETLKAGDSQFLLTQAGMVKVPVKARKLLRDLSAGMKGASARVEEDQVIASKSEGPFRAVSMMMDAGRGLEMHCPLMIVAETKEGARVLVDIELWLPTNRGKKMRNATALLQLQKDLSEADMTALKALFVWHEEVARPVWDAWDEKRNEKK